MSKYSDQIKTKIDTSPDGSAFVVSDFTGISDYQTAKKTLARLCESGVIRRVIRGVYDKPIYSKLLKEYSAPDLDQVAKAIARNFNWNIIPSGNVALNMLGLSTQVPAKWEYCSSGPYRDYVLGNTTIEFKHRSSKEIEGYSYETALLIQAIKALGKENITDDVITKLKVKTNLMDKNTIIEEARYTNAWVYSVIKVICGKD